MEKGIIIENHLNKLAILLARHQSNIGAQPHDLRQQYEGQDFSGRLAAGQDKLGSILEIISRPHLKLVFVGRTSSGKSSAINALLGDGMLPMGLGHTSSCFVEIRGSNQAHPTMSIPGSESGVTEELTVRSMNEFGNALASHPLTPDSCIQLFWPRSRSSLLKDDVVIIDSPGLDVERDFDGWIDQFCMDADLFVWVLNGESTLMMREKAFFHEIKAKIARPNVLVLVNRWDCATGEEDYWIQATREQHLERTWEFFHKELGMNVTKSEVLQRMFFVSAREQIDKCLGTDPTLNSAKLMEERNTEWDRFVPALASHLSFGFKGRRFVPYIEVALVVLQDLRKANQFLLDLGHAILQDNEGRAETVAQSMASLEDGMEALIQELKVEIQNILQGIGDTVKLGFQDELENISTLVAEFQAVFYDDDPIIMDVYRSQLIRHLEIALAMDLSTCLSMNVRNLVSEVQSKILSRVQEFLPADKRDFLDHQPRSMPIELNFFLQERKLFDDFHEDIQFRFSPSPQTIYRYYIQLRRKLTSCEPSEDEEISWRRAVHWTLQATVATSEASILALLGVALIYRNARAKCLLSLGLIFGACYSVEKLMWTSRAKERSIKCQFEEFAVRKLRPLANDIACTCSDQVQKELTNTLVLACGAAEGIGLALKSELVDLEDQNRDISTLMVMTNDLIESSCELHGQLTAIRKDLL